MARNGGRTHAEILLRDESGRKMCARCKSWYPESDYYPNKTGVDGLKSSCRYCLAEHDNLKRHHVTVDWYNETLKKQGNRCAICRRGEPGGHNGFFWVVDHDHNHCPGTYSCGSCVRGLLCRSCNIAISTFKEDPDIFRRGIEYITKEKSYA